VNANDTDGAVRFSIVRSGSVGQVRVYWRVGVEAVNDFYPPLDGSVLFRDVITSLRLLFLLMKFIVPVSLHTSLLHAFTTGLNLMHAFSPITDSCLDYYVPPPMGLGHNDVVCPSVCIMPLLDPKSRTEGPDKLKIGRKEAHDTGDP